MKTLTRPGHNALCIAVAIAVVAFLAHGAKAKGGKPGAAAATLEFRDAAFDAVQSDGLGPYDVAVTEDQFDIVVSLTKNQATWLDFSDCDPVQGLSCEGPFGPDTTSDYVDSATIALPNLDWTPGVTEHVGVSIGFQVSGQKWKLLKGTDVTPYDDDDDGVIDRFVIEEDGTTSAKLLKGYAQRRGSGGFTYLEDGRFFMPWGATLQLQ